MGVAAEYGFNVERSLRGSGQSVDEMSVAIRRWVARGEARWCMLRRREGSDELELYDNNRGDVQMKFLAPAPEVFHLLDCNIACYQRWLSVVEYANLVRGLSVKDRLLNDIPPKRILMGLRHLALEREITVHEEMRERQLLEVSSS